MNHKQLDVALMIVHLALREQLANGRTPTEAKTARLAKDYARNVTTTDAALSVALACIDFKAMRAALEGAV